MTLNLSLVISGDASGGKRAVQETRAEVRNLSADAKATAAAMIAANDQADVAARRVIAALTGQELAHQRIQSAVNRYAGFSLPNDDAAYRQRASDIAAYGNELDRLRAKYSPQFALMQQYEAELAEINQLHRVGAFDAREHAAAIAAVNERLANQKQAAAGGPSAGMQRFAGFNAGQQIQDIAITAAMGMPIGSIALAQGPQLATAIQQGGGWKSAVAGIASLVSPVNLVAIGLTAVTAATIQWAMSGKDSAKKLDEALDEHQASIERLKQSYGDLGVAIRSATPTGGLAFTDAQARNALSLLQAQIRERTNPLLDTLGGAGWMQRMLGNGGGVAGLQNLSGQQREFSEPVARLVASARAGAPDLAGFNDQVERLFDQFVKSSENPTALRATADAVLLLGNNAFAVDGKFAPFSDAINKLRVEAAEGKPKLDEFIASVEKTGRENGLQKLADDAILTGKELVSLVQQAAELEKIVRRLEAGKRGPLIGSGADDARNAYLDDQRLTLRSAQRGFDADMGALGARSPQELAAAARAREAARDNAGESYEVRNQRIELAGKRALLEAEHSLTEAQVQRRRALDETLASARLDVELVGRNAAETARLRMEHQLIAEVRSAAAEAGVKADEAEIARIREKMGEYQKLVSQQSARELLLGQGEEIERLRLETALVGASAATRARAIALMEAEQEMRRRGVETLSQEAQQYRAGALAAADMQIALERQADAWELVKSAGENAIDSTIGSLAKGDWKSALTGIVEELASAGLALPVGNPLRTFERKDLL